MKQVVFTWISLTVGLGFLGCRTTETMPDTLSFAEGSLSHWSFFLEDPNTTKAEVWQIEDEILICRGTPRGYLYTPQDYRDFTLRLDWRWPPGQEPGKGGVLIRMTGEHCVWPRSLEAQINVGDAGDFWGLAGYELSGDAERRRTLVHDTFGQLTHLKKAQAQENPPGQWNHYEIVAHGETVTLFINGEQVNQALGCDVEPGKICLTSEGTEIHFRNLSIITE